MTGAATDKAGSGSATFTLERFEWGDEGRIELAGVWSGVPEQKFARPALLLDVDGKSRSLPAVMDHKPWTAQDGERWEPAFTWAGEPVGLEAARLRVAPGIELELPPLPLPAQEPSPAPL